MVVLSTARTWRGKISSTANGSLKQEHQQQAEIQKRQGSCKQPNRAAIGSGGSLSSRFLIVAILAAGYINDQLPVCIASAGHMQ